MPLVFARWSFDIEWPPQKLDASSVNQPRNPHPEAIALNAPSTVGSVTRKLGQTGAAGFSSPRPVPARSALWRAMATSCSFRRRITTRSIPALAILSAALLRSPERAIVTKAAVAFASDTRVWTLARLPTTRDATESTDWAAIAAGPWVFRMIASAALRSFGVKHSSGKPAVDGSAWGSCVGSRGGGAVSPDGTEKFGFDALASPMPTRDLMRASIPVLRCCSGCDQEIGRSVFRRKRQEAESCGGGKLFRPWSGAVALQSSRGQGTALTVRCRVWITIRSIACGLSAVLMMVALSSMAEF